MRSSVRSFCPSRNFHTVVKALKVISNTEPTSEYGLAKINPLPEISIGQITDFRPPDAEAGEDQNRSAETQQCGPSKPGRSRFRNHGEERQPFLGRDCYGTQLLQIKHHAEFLQK